MDLPGLAGLDRCLVMGVLNVTPDSFSDGGEFPDARRAVAGGLALHASGADLVDVGGESTRPGAARVSVEQETARVVPVVRDLAAAGVPVSVDTTRADVARAALDAGARVVNDVSGGLADPDLPRVVAAAGVPYVVMHWRGHSADMQQRATYSDVVREVCAELTARLGMLRRAGVDPGQVILDPGLGFAKTAAHNWALLAGLDALLALGRPVLVGASRKSFLGDLLATSGAPRPPREREAASLAVATLAADRGAWGVRVHDAGAAADAVRVVAALRSARPVQPARAARSARSAEPAPATGPERAGASP